MSLPLLGAGPSVDSSGPPPAAAWPSLIGTEMMVNGDCSSGTGWTLGAGTVIAAGKMTLTASSSTSANSGVPDTSLIDGAAYRNAFTIDTVSLGSVRVLMGLTLGTSYTTTGAKTQDLAYSATEDGWALSPTSATMQLDSFSVKSVGLNGVITDWTFTGDGSFSDGFLRTGGSDNFSGALTGSAKTAFDAAVSNSTACTVTLTEEPSYVSSGPVMISLKGGTPVQFTFVGGVAAPQVVTSGTGSGFLYEDNGIDVAEASIARVQITTP